MGVKKNITKIALLFLIIISLALSVSAQTVCFTNQTFDYTTTDELLADGWYYSGVPAITEGYNVVENELQVLGGQGAISTLQKNLNYTNSLGQDIDISAATPFNCSEDDFALEYDITMVGAKTSGFDNSLEIGFGDFGTAGFNNAPFMNFQGSTTTGYFSRVATDSNLFSWITGYTYRVKNTLEWNGSACLQDLFIDNVKVFDDLPTGELFYRIEFENSNLFESGAYTIDNVQFYNGNLANRCETTSPCGAEHIIFCDNFNYNTPLSSTNDWDILTNGNYNNSVAPVSDKMTFNALENVDIANDLPETQVDYDSRERYTVIVSDSYPIVTHTFKLESDQNITYTILDSALRPSVDIKIENNNIYAYNTTLGDYTLLDSFAINTEHDIKITQYLGLDTAAVVPLDFNVTQNNSHYDIWLDSSQVGNDFFYRDVRSSTISNLRMVTTNANFTLDDLFIYRGQSQTVNTEAPYIIQLWVDPDEVIQGNLDAGSPCFSNDECITGFCSAQFCRLKPSLAACDFDAQCISGVCGQGNRCTQAGMWETTDEGVRQIFGNSAATLNFVSLLLMLSIAVGIIWIGASHGAVKPSVIVAGMVFISMALFFTIVGWLSAWITFGIFIVAIAGGLLAFFMGGSN